jgi:hypothetical protein
MPPSFPLQSSISEGQWFESVFAPLRCGCPPWAAHLSFSRDMRYRAGLLRGAANLPSCLKIRFRDNLSEFLKNKKRALVIGRAFSFAGKLFAPY